MNNHEENPEAPAGKAGKRHTYQTVEDFRRAVGRASCAPDLCTLTAQLRRGAGVVSDIHPWQSFSPEYQECWKILFERARLIRAQYCKGSRFPFQAITPRPH